MEICALTMGNDYIYIYTQYIYIYVCMCEIVGGRLLLVFSIYFPVHIMSSKTRDGCGKLLARTNYWVFYFLLQKKLFG